MDIETIENIRYNVVVNQEGQYSLWMYGRENAPGWEDAGVAGTKAECLAYIRKTWTDMRPLSLRNAMSPAKNMVHDQQEMASLCVAA
jgi:MbtH protein